MAQWKTIHDPQDEIDVFRTILYYNTIYFSQTNPILFSSTLDVASAARLAKNMSFFSCAGQG